MAHILGKDASEKQMNYFIVEVWIWITMSVMLGIDGLVSTLDGSEYEDPYLLSTITEYAFYILLPLVLTVKAIKAIKAIKVMKLKKRFCSIIYFALSVFFIIFFWFPWQSLIFNNGITSYFGS